MIGGIKSRKVGGVAAEAGSAGAPDRVERYAKSLGLGELRASSPTAGGRVFEFVRGSIRFAEGTGRICGIEARGGELPLAVAKAAVRLKLGSYKRNVGAVGSRFWEFSGGIVRWSKVENKLSAVKAKDVWLPRGVVSEAVKQRLGGFKGERSSETRIRYEFDRGTVVAQRKNGEVVDVAVRQPHAE